MFFHPSLKHSLLFGAVASARGNRYFRTKTASSAIDIGRAAPLEEDQLWKRYLQFSASVTSDHTASPFLSTLSPTSTPPATATCQNILWSEEFSSDTLNMSIWNYDTGRGADGWGNFELQSYTNENIRLEDGSAIITIREEIDEDGGRTFSSTRINTQDKVEVQYGTLEARIKLPVNGLKDGLWPAFWTLGGNFREVGWPAAGEIDILEMGAAPAIQDNTINKHVTSAVHWEFEGNQADFAESFDASIDLNDGEFHIFRMEWTSSQITTFVDDNRVMGFDIGLDICFECSEFHQPHMIILNVAVGGLFTGILDATGITASLPAEFEVDYVRVCDNGESIVTGTALEGSQEFAFDCGLPSTCTVAALNNYADGEKCGSRIQFLINSGFTEEVACQQVAHDEFPNFCGVCWGETLDCGVPGTCTADVLAADADGFPCGDRINFLIQENGQSEFDACTRVAVDEFAEQCGGCAPPAMALNCGVPGTCTADVLAADADGFPCGDRINFLIQENGQSEFDACTTVAVDEFAEQCGGCNPSQ
jgi:beta-glucanase (GH16 family)